MERRGEENGGGGEENGCGGGANCQMKNVLFRFATLVKLLVLIVRRIVLQLGYELVLRNEP